MNLIGFLFKKKRRSRIERKLQQYRQELEKVKQGYVVWPKHASQEEMLQALDDYLKRRPVRWYKQ